MTTTPPGKKGNPAETLVYFEIKGTGNASFAWYFNEKSTIPSILGIDATHFEGVSIMNKGKTSFWMQIRPSLCWSGWPWPRVEVPADNKLHFFKWNQFEFNQGTSFPLTCDGPHPTQDTSRPPIIKGPYQNGFDIAKDLRVILLENVSDGTEGTIQLTNNPKISLFKIAILELNLDIIQSIHTIKASDKCINSGISYLTNKNIKINNITYLIKPLRLFDIDYVAIKRTVQDAEDLLEQYLQQHNHEFLLLPESDNQSNKLYINLHDIKDITYNINEEFSIKNVNDTIYVSQIELNKLNFNKKYATGKLIITDENNTYTLPFTKNSNQIKFTFLLEFALHKKYIVLVYGEENLEILHQFYIQVIDTIKDSIHSALSDNKSLTINLLNKTLHDSEPVKTITSIIDPFTNQRVDISQSVINITKINDVYKLESLDDTTAIINTMFETDSIIFKNNRYFSSLDVIDTHYLKTKDNIEIKEITKRKLNTAFINALNKFYKSSKEELIPLNLDKIKESYNKYGKNFYNIMRFVKYNMLFNKDWEVYPGATHYKSLNESTEYKTKQLEINLARGSTINKEVYYNSKKITINNNYTTFNQKIMPNSNGEQQILDNNYWDNVYWVSDGYGKYKNVTHNSSFNVSTNLLASDISYTIELENSKKEKIGISGNVVFTSSGGTAHLYDISNTNCGTVILVDDPFRVVADISNLLLLDYGYIKLYTYP